MALVETADRLPYARPKLDWGHALRSLQRLLNDKEDTGQVFEIMGALNGPTTAPVSTGSRLPANRQR